MTHLCFVPFLVCLHVCVCECLLQNNMRMYTSNQYEVSEVNCGSAVRFGQTLPGCLITTHHLYASLLYLSRQLCGSITHQNPNTSKDRTKMAMRRKNGDRAAVKPKMRSGPPLSAMGQHTLPWPACALAGPCATMPRRFSQTLHLKTTPAAEWQTEFRRRPSFASEKYTCYTVVC